jgi:L-aminopeptidase/D-esterase-like protein
MGLAAASGVANVLAAEKIGFDVSVSYVPVVPSACLFDLTLGENTAPNEAMGEAAARKALSLRGSDKDRNLEQGNVGAGTGASVGKMGEASQCMKSGFGWAGVQSGGLVVVASVAVNAAGNVYNFDGTPLAGVVTPEGAIEDARELMVNNSRSSDECFSAGSTATPCENTTLGVVLTNAHLTKAQATKVSQITQDAYARRIKPVHTLSDGDAIFTMASGEVEAPVDVVAVLATEAMEQAIVSAINHAQSAYGLPCAADIR